VINLKIAKALGFTVPPTLLAGGRGDRIGALFTTPHESAFGLVAESARRLRHFYY
jgi:hypothetical protein